MFERTLPIGSIVRLKEATKKIMIIGYCKYMGEDKSRIYDYAGCVYPEGVLSPETTLLFDHGQIERIYALGFQDEARFAFEEELAKAIRKVKP